MSSAEPGLREAAQAVVLAATKHTPEIAALNRVLTTAPFEGQLRRDIIAANPECAACGHSKVHHFGATDGKAPPPNERRCWVDKCRCKGWSADPLEGRTDE